MRAPALGGTVDHGAFRRRYDSCVPSTKSSLPLWVALVGSGFAGALIAVQSRLNGGLSQQLGDPYLTAALSFGTGLGVAAIFAALSRRGRKGFGLVWREFRSGHLPWWALCGGAFGAFLVLSQGLVATVLGLAMFTVGIVAGQVLGGLLIDRMGIGPGGRVDPTWPRVLGTVLALAAVAFSVFADLFAAEKMDSKLWLIVVPILVGAGVSLQSAVNGVLRSAAQSALTATTISFLFGTLLLGAIAAVSVSINGWPTAWPSEPFYYLGGALGTIFIGLAAVLVRTAGVLLLSMSNVAGQLIASVAIEMGMPLAGGVTSGMLVGTCIALFAVLIATIPSKKRA